MYDDFGSQAQPVSEPSNSSGPETANPPKNSQKKKYLLVAIVGIIILVGAFFAYNYLFGPGVKQTEVENEEVLEGQDETNTPTLGNGICDLSENCLDDLAECPCPDKEYCSNESKSCVKPSCRNNRCEYFETPDNCPEDCGCYDGQVFNETKKLCEEKEFTLSDGEVNALVSEYFIGKGSNVTSSEIVNMTSTWKNEVGINVLVYLDNETDFKSILVLQNKTVIDTGY